MYDAIDKNCFDVVKYSKIYLYYLNTGKIRKVWRHQRGNHKPQTYERHAIQISWEKFTSNGRQKKIA